MVELINRSYIYVPGDRPEMLARAGARGADALIVDLEDSVTALAKPAAHEIVARWLGDTRMHPSQEVWVRVNSFSSSEPEATMKDLRAVVGPALAGICLAKCHSVEDVSRLDRLLTDEEQRADLTPGSVRLAPLVESARGLLAAPSIATAARVTRLHLGEADLAAELGIRPGPEELELLPLRLQIVVAASAAGIEAPIGAVSTDFRDLDRFRLGTERLKRLGFSGRAVIHPDQIPIANAVFTPSDEELAHAQSVVARSEAAASQGSGVALDEKGRMVDDALVRVARHTLSLADRKRSTS